ncbi:CaiB/BaiF CoA transferase family protein [Bradyrhizobium sp.]|uniref:CaiB/BaiF CoA transferase family protein n=1 Tax=Bradyrhizobium sp. TaxID=376 RepID=UPI0039E271CB
MSVGKALDNIRVLDLTRVRAGPSAVRQLADWGAEVIKVELPEDIGTDGPRHSSDFQNLHRNKRSVALNLKSDGGRAIFYKLAARADVVVENFRPNVKERLGIDYESLRAVNPRLVYASISGYGQDGPYASRPGLDQIAQGMAGLMSITGLPGQGPVRAGIAVADMGAGMYCANGILIALLERERSGEGQWIQTSLLQAQIALLDFQGARWLVEKEVAGQAGNDHPTMAPMGMFPTADGHINIAPFGEVMWRRLCGILDIPEAASDERFTDAKKRIAHRAELNDILSEATRRQPSAAWIERLNREGIPCGPIYAIDQVFADPQVRHLAMTGTVNHRLLGEMELIGQPIQMSRSSSRFETAAPERGEHTDEILQELGLDAAAIEAARASGAI